MEGPGNCSVIGWNQRLSPMSAALLNSTYIQGFELDDVHADAPWHANSVILPALFAAAEHASRGLQGPAEFDGSSFLLSTIVGFEIGSRVGHALYGSEMLSRGWHSVSIVMACADPTLKDSTGCSVWSPGCRCRRLQAPRSLP